MTYLKVKSFIIILFFTFINTCVSQDFMLNLMQDELEFQQEKYKDKEDAPYFIQFNTVEIKNFETTASLGSLLESSDNHVRYFLPEIRMGSYEVDNTHLVKSIPDYGMNPFSHLNNILLSVEDSALQISNTMRKAFDKSYENVQELYKKKSKKLKELEKKQERDDFSREEVSTYYEANIDELKLDKKQWENNIKALTEVFRKDTHVLGADASFRHQYSRKYIINSEGSSVVQNVTNIQLYVFVLVKCSDGNTAPLSHNYFVSSMDDLPSLETMLEDMEKLRTISYQLKDAPSSEPYSGPCILSASAAGVFFHEILGHRIEGHRLNQMADAQTLKNKIGDRILPKFMNITFDPTVETSGQNKLVGHYKFDDQAVKARKVDVVKDGNLVDFLMCRTPTDEISKSNGHGRGMFFTPTVSRQSNMFVSASKVNSDEELRKGLIKACRKKKLEYGLYFKEVSGGYTNTTVFSPNTFNIIPILVYKVFTDGRPDELVKGVSLIGTPLNMFSEISKIGDKEAVFNGYCGAESGMIPVSAISPAILVNKIETQRMFESEATKTHIVRPDLLK